MSELRDPPRWLDGDLLPDVRSELAAYAREAPGLERSARMFAGLERELGLVQAPEDKLFEAGPPRDESGIEVAGKAGTLKLLWAGVALVVGAVGLFALWSNRALPASLRYAPSEGVQGVPWAVTEPSFELLAAETAPAVAEPAVFERGPEPFFARAPEGALRLARSQRVRVVPPSMQPEPPPDHQHEVENTRADPVAELALLAPARRALLSQPAHALEFTEVHARDYPHGTFAEEREVLAIESLCRLGLTAEAKQRALLFEQRFPNSAQRAHLTRMMQTLSR